MEYTPIPLAKRALTVAGLALLALSTTGCQDLRTYVTGERFVRAPEDSPRVEIELDVEVHDSFFRDLEDSVGREELVRAVSEAVLTQADMGMRFYPILSEDYGSKQARPQYVMIVRVQDLAVGIDYETIEEEGREPWISTSVDGVDCSVTATVQKRRVDAPPLVVGQGRGVGSVRVHDTTEAPVGPRYDVRRDNENLTQLQVSQEDMCAVAEEAVVDALRQVVKAVDRDFALAGDVSE